jgi:hypothetical protein
MDEQIMKITQKLRLKDINPGAAKAIAEQHGMKEDDVQLIRKGLIPTDLEIKEGERAVISYISTAAVDRDGEIVEPEGAVLTDYMKHPVVLFGHDYKKLPIGKCEWVKMDAKGLIAKTIYASHEEAQRVFNYRKEGFPLAESIGFVPLEVEELTEAESKLYGGARRRYTKWTMLEYSDVPIPSNPEALQIAIAKGLVDEPTSIVKDVEIAEAQLEKKEGRVLSKKNRTAIKNAIVVLQELYAATEEQKEVGVEVEKSVIEELPKIKSEEELQEPDRSNKFGEIANDLKAIIKKLQ